MRSAAVKARICAANNADLYEAVFRAHGLEQHRNPFLWWSESPAPPYYSNMTTLDPDAVEFQHQAVKQLSSALDGPFAVKDGFCRLDLASLGFKLLFSASWTWADSGRAIGATRSRMASTWQRVRDTDALLAWEEAWAADNLSDRRVFPTAILDNPDIAFFGRASAGGFDAGCIVNRSPEAVGLSNVFANGVAAATAYQDAANSLLSMLTIFRSSDMSMATRYMRRSWPASGQLEACVSGSGTAKERHDQADPLRLRLQCLCAHRADDAGGKGRRLRARASRHLRGRRRSGLVSRTPPVRPHSGLRA